MKKPQKHYDAQFKRDAVELLLTSGRPLKRLATELGVCDVTLRDRRDRHLAKYRSPLSGSLPACVSRGERDAMGGPWEDDTVCQRPKGMAALSRYTSARPPALPEVGNEPV